MSVRDFFHGYGEIDTKGGFASTRLVRDTLKRDFRIRIVEESPKHIKCKIYRFIRFTGFPVIFPNPTLDIVWESRAEGRIITYYLTCYDYYVVAVGALIFGILCMRSEPTQWEALKFGLSGAVMAMLFFGGLVFLDTKYLMYRIRKALLKLTV